MDTSVALEAFGALSQPTRLAVFRLLLRAGPEGLAAGDIARSLGVKQNTMSANLAVLKASGLARAARDGRSIRYAADTAVVRDLLAFLLEDCCQGRPELCRPVLDAVVATSQVGS